MVRTSDQASEILAVLPSIAMTRPQGSARATVPRTVAPPHGVHSTGSTASVKSESMVGASDITAVPPARR